MCDGAHDPLDDRGIRTPSHLVEPGVLVWSRRWRFRESHRDPRFHDSRNTCPRHGVERLPRSKRLLPGETYCQGRCLGRCRGPLPGTLPGAASRAAARAAAGSAACQGRCLGRLPGPPAQGRCRGRCQVPAWAAAGTLPLPVKTRCLTELATARI